VHLVEALAASFEPQKYTDTYRETLRAMIQAKVEGQEIVAPPATQELAPVIDIMEALKSSLAALKKPPTPAVESAEEPAALVLTSPAGSEENRSRGFKTATARAGRKR
jgi:non-homologous end joining protein Ku